jgi:hypothetical protein
VVQVPPPQPPPQPPPDPPKPPAPPEPPRTPTDAASLKDSLTRPGTTVLTPTNLPGLAPDVLTKDGKIKINPKAPAPLKALDGIQAPTPTIADGTVSMDLPLTMGEVKVQLNVQDGRLVGDTSTSGKISVLEGASLMLPDNQQIDVGKAVQSRLDRYNQMIEKAKLEVKGVKADGGTIQVITGPKG